MITINVSVHSNPKGNGFWMLNMSLLADTTFVEKKKQQYTVQKIPIAFQTDGLRGYITDCRAWSIHVDQREKLVERRG